LIGPYTIVYGILTTVCMFHAFVFFIFINIYTYIVCNALLMPITADNVFLVPKLFKSYYFQYCLTNFYIFCILFTLYHTSYLTLYFFVILNYNFLDFVFTKIIYKIMIYNNYLFFFFINIIFV
jgi:hypothetical protein